MLAVVLVLCLVYLPESRDTAWLALPIGAAGRCARRPGSRSPWPRRTRSTATSSTSSRRCSCRWFFLTPVLYDLDGIPGADAAPLARRPDPLGRTRSRPPVLAVRDPLFFGRAPAGGRRRSTSSSRRSRRSRSARSSSGGWTTGSRSKSDDGASLVERRPRPPRRAGRRASPTARARRATTGGAAVLRSAGCGPGPTTRRKRRASRRRSSRPPAGSSRGPTAAQPSACASSSRRDQSAAGLAPGDEMRDGLGLDVDERLLLRGERGPCLLVLAAVHDDAEPPLRDPRRHVDRRPRARTTRPPRTRSGAPRPGRTRAGTGRAAAGRRACSFALERLAGPDRLREGRALAVPDDRVAERVEPVRTRAARPRGRASARSRSPRSRAAPRATAGSPARTGGTRYPRQRTASGPAGTGCSPTRSTAAASLGRMDAPLLVRAARREQVERTPVWFMRQAGRSLPEYRAIRERHTLFEVCEQPELCAEVTLQPVRRHDVDAAVMFADIMLPVLVDGRRRRARRERRPGRRASRSARAPTSSGCACRSRRRRRADPRGGADRARASCGPTRPSSASAAGRSRSPATSSRGSRAATSRR